MCIGVPSAQKPQAPPAAPTPLSVEERTAKTADTPGKAKSKRRPKKESFRRKKSGGTRLQFGGVSKSGKSLNLTPKKTN